MEDICAMPVVARSASSIWSVHESTCQCEILRYASFLVQTLDKNFIMMPVHPETMVA